MAEEEFRRLNVSLMEKLKVKRRSSSYFLTDNLNGIGMTVSLNLYLSELIKKLWMYHRLKSEDTGA